MEALIDRPVREDGLTETRPEMRRSMEVSAPGKATPELHLMTGEEEEILEVELVRLTLLIIITRDKMLRDGELLEVTLCVLSVVHAQHNSMSE